ncbi:MAG: hypothetical protein GWN62_30380 [Aliifodinibius sp.]|nr:hypothetical protein [Phycisphaerae bacterium]NIV15406.1 hypothetical protein [Fodinibius sp.]NIX27072.1 hypothetical protein [Phycisphaerae bacterium]
MKLAPVKFGIASAVAFSIAWVVCSLLVMTMQSTMMTISGHMIHGDLSNMRWNLGMHGFFMGLVSWAIVAGFTGWLIALIYNALAD